MSMLPSGVSDERTSKEDIVGVFLKITLTKGRGLAVSPTHLKHVAVSTRDSFLVGQASTVTGPVSRSCSALAHHPTKPSPGGHLVPRDKATSPTL